MTKLQTSNSHDTMDYYRIPLPEPIDITKSISSDISRGRQEGYFVMLLSAGVYTIFEMEMVKQDCYYDSCIFPQLDGFVSFISLYTPSSCFYDRKKVWETYKGTMQIPS